jgi:hypothetical protein
MDNQHVSEERVIDLGLIDLLIRGMGVLSPREKDFVRLALDRSESSCTTRSHPLTGIKEISAADISLARRLSNTLLLPSNLEHKIGTHLYCGDYRLHLEPEPVHHGVGGRSPEHRWFVRPDDVQESRPFTSLDLWADPRPESFCRYTLGSSLYKVVLREWRIMMCQHLWQTTVTRKILKVPIRIEAVKCFISPATIVLAQHLIRQRYGWYSPAEVNERLDK